MKLTGIIGEPPYDPLSWSGTARYFFRALDDAGVLNGAVDAGASRFSDRLFRARSFTLPVSAWKEHYHLDVRRFNALTALAAQRVRESGVVPEGYLQIGAWYCMPNQTRLPCYSYHDGNLALRIRSGKVGLPPDDPVLQRALEWERSTYSKMSGIFVMSSWLGDSFVEDFGVPREKVHVVGAGVNLDSLPDAIVRRHTVPRFLMVGKDFERKGGVALLQAFSVVRGRFPTAELVLVGPTLSSPPPGVTCLGFLSKKIPEQLALLEKTYREAGIYVLPSLYEPFGISVLEAMGYSLPCIVANHCAMPEIVAHDTTGLVVKPGDVDSLAAAMIALAGAPDVCAQMGASGRVRLQARYTWKAVAEKIGAVVEGAP